MKFVYQSNYDRFIILIHPKFRHISKYWKKSGKTYQTFRYLYLIIEIWNGDLIFRLLFNFIANYNRI